MKKFKPDRPMKCKLYFLALLVTLCLSFLMNSVFAALAFDSADDKRLPVDFLSVPDWVDMTFVGETPAKVVMQLVRERKVALPISTYYQDGPAYPELISVFKNEVDGRRTLFVIVKWRYYLSGVDTEGDYYEVHAYQPDTTYANNVRIIENEKLSNIFGSGFDGRREGEKTSFRFKDAASIRNFLHINQMISKR